jgi:hypothetical protein
VFSFEHVNFAINGKYSKKHYDNPKYYVSLAIFQAYKNKVLMNVHSLGGSFDCDFTHIGIVTKGLKNGHREEGMEDNNDGINYHGSTRRQHVFSLLKEDPPLGSFNKNQNHHASKRHYYKCGV